MNNNFVTPFLPIFGLLSGVKPHLKCLHWSFHIRRTPWGRLWHCFLAFALSNKLMSILLPIFCINPFGLLSVVKPHLKLLAFVIPYSGNPRVRYDIVFSLGSFYINKNQFFYPFFCWLQRVNLGWKRHPKPASNPFSGYWWHLKSTHGVKHFGPLNMNNRPGLPVYIVIMAYIIVT